MNELNSTQTKQLAKAIYAWRKSYKAMETSPEVEKARKAVERAGKRLIEAESLFKTEIKESEKVIIELTTLIGSSVLAFGIRAKFRKAYDRITYDRAVLDRIASENTRIKNLIYPHRKVSPVKSGVSVEVADPLALLNSVKFSPVLEIK